MNICVENLSLTENGNDFGIDQISFRECQNPNVDAFDQLLRGDPCELANGPEVLGVFLSANFLDFTGRLIGDAVALNWLTVNEGNIYAYEVQRSIDGNNFHPVGQVDAQGQRDEVNDYTFLDRELPEGAPYLYYRLRILYQDGTSKLGTVVAIDTRALEGFDMQLIPNPTAAGDEVEVRFDVPKGQARVRIVSLMGLPMYQEVVETQSGSNSVFVPTGQLAPGIYIVEVMHNQKGKRVTKRLVII